MKPAPRAEESVPAYRNTYIAAMAVSMPGIHHSIGREPAHSWMNSSATSATNAMPIVAALWQGLHWPIPFVIDNSTRARPALECSAPPLGPHRRW